MSHRNKLIYKVRADVLEDGMSMTVFKVRYQIRENN